jgi:type I restriction enzyme S subunit
MTRSNRPTDNWTRVRFGDVVHNSTAVSRDPAGEGFTRYIIGKHIDENRPRVESWGDVGDPDFGPRIRTIFLPGDVICTTRGPKLKIATVDFRGLGAHTNFVLRTRDPEVLLQSYLGSIVRSAAFQQHLAKHFRGSVNLFVNWSDASLYELELPPLELQEESVETLRRADQLVSSLEVAQGLAQTTVRALRETHLAPRPLVALGTLLKGIEAGSSVVGRNEPPMTLRERGVLKVSAVGKNGFRPTESKVLIRDQDFLPSASVKAGQLLMTRCNTPDLVGLSCIVEKDYPNLMLCDKTLNLVPSDGVSPKWLWHSLQMKEVREQLKAAASGTGAAMKNVSQSAIRALLVRSPSSESDTVVAQLDQVLQAERCLRDRVAAARELRKRILARTMVPA